MKKILLFAVACGLILTSQVFAQPGCPAVTIPQKDVNGNYPLPCDSTCGTLTAVPFAGAQTTDYSVSPIAYAPPFAYNTGTQVLVNVDDTWSQAIALPFRFCFFGTGYTNVIIGSNGAISFNTGNAGTFNNWSIPGPAPLGAQRVDMRNSIMAPWQDIDPTNQGQIFYELGGVAPCRYLKVSWYEAPMFGDPNSVSTTLYSNNIYRQTQQIVLYETTNVIDIYIQQKEVLAGWNGGLAIEGLQDATGNVAVTVPGRNATQWTATNDAYRFTPIGAPNYTVAWYLASNNTLLGTNTTLRVCPATSGTKYRAEVTYNSCGVTGVVVNDSVAVVFSGLTATLDSVKQITCPNANDGAVYASFNSTTAVLSYGWSPGGAGQTSLTGLGPGTYTFTATDFIGCTQSVTAVITTPAPFTVTVPDTTIAACTSGGTGTLVANVSGGTPNYSYSWSNSAVTPSITEVAGTYAVTVTDAQSCTATGSGTITINAVSIAFDAPVITNATCGASNGSITVSTTGGTNPVTYTWSNGLPNGSAQTGLAANTYSVTATDNNGCSVSAQYTVTSTNGISFGPAVVTDATCVDDGSIVVTVVGATDPITYAWSNSLPNNDTVTGLGSGIYTVTATDANGCTASASYSINKGPGITFNPPVIVNSNCGQSNGSIVVSINGGTNPVTYTWSNPLPSNDTVTGLAAGTYDVTATDANGCSVTASYTITDIVISFGTPQITDAGCTNTGSIIVTVVDATDPIDYTWSGGQPNNDTLLNLAAGTYDVTAVDANGCSATASYNVGTAPNNLAFAAPVIVDVTCNGGSDGSITASTTGGVGTVTYAWNTTPQQTTAGISGLTAGTYSVTATDANGCSVSTSYTVNEPTAITLGAPVITDATCLVGGTVTVTATGGTGTLTYVWSNGDNGTLADSLTAGAVNLTVTDASGCSVTATYNIGSVPNTLAFGAPTIVNVSCNGGNDGAITATTTGGTGTVTFAWSTTPTQTTATISNLTAGAYSVTITDSLGCSASATYNVTEPTAIVIGTPTITPATCLVGGSVTVTATGGTGILTYDWSNGDSGNLADSISSGSVSLTVTDANGCSATASYNVPVSNGITLTANVTNISCNGANDGNITLIVSGGTYPYVYTWNQAVGPDSIAAGLSAGTYLVTVTDAGGCSATGTYSITEPAAIVLGNPVITDETCVDGGTVTVTATGGTGTLTYVWSNGDNGTLADSLTAGAVNLTVTDASGCSVTATYNIGSAPNTLAFGAPAIVNVSCNGGNDGAITATTTGGTGTVTFAWSTTPTQTTATISNLTAGAYSVTITDSLGCSATATYNVTEPTAIVIGTPTITPATCLVGGSVTVTATGGTGVLTYDWSNGDSGNLADSISGGSVTLTVTDANGCSATASYNVPVSSGITLTANVTNISCNGANDGNITLIVSGGTYPYDYTWNQAVGPDSIAAGLSAGTYLVTVTDAGGCSATGTYNITEPAAIVLGNPLITDETCTTGGTVTVTATGGTGTLTYVWSNGDNGTLADSLTAGAVNLTVTDASGCSVTATYNIGSVPNTLAFGAPTIVNVSCNGGNDGEVTATTTGGTGTVTFAWSTTPTQTTATISNLTAGAYTVTITDSLGCSATATYNVTEPTAIVIGTPTITPATCLVGGSVTVTATGGTGVLTYDWSNGDSGNLADSISGGSVTLTVTDANGCSATASYNVPVSNGIDLGTSTATNITCFGANNGSIRVIALGATAPVTYVWNPLATSTDSLANGLSAGTYSVTVSDAGGCSATASYTIAEPSAITLGNAAITNQTCTTGGTVTVTATGGTGVLTYAWSNGDNGTLADSLTAGAVNLTVSDLNGCSVTATYNIIAVGSAVTFGAPTLTQPTCNGGTNGSITVTTTGGLGTVVYTWNPGSSNTATLSNIGAGSYSVTATDSLGCTATATYTLGQPAAIDLGTPNITQVTCQRGGSVTINPTGGVSPFTINWSNGDSGNTADSLAAGAVTVTVTDGNTCSVTGSYNISNSGATIVFGTPIINNVSCNGANDGSITVNASGGTGGITFNWANPATVGSTIVGLAPGQYTVVASDQGGCSATATYTITQPAPLTVVVGATPLICNGATNGTAEAFASGGTPGYTYTWNPNNGNGSTISNLPVGIVLVTVTDANGCTAKDDSIIGQSTALSYYTRIDQPSCSPFGTETLVPRDGFGAVRIEIAALGVDTTLSRVGGDTTLVIPNVPAGNFTFTLTDALGCTNSGVFEVNPGTSNQQFDVVTAPTSCFGKAFNDGGLVITALTPANAPYQYSLDGSNFQDSGVFNNLTAGAYNITVRNVDGCLETVPATVGEPAQLVVNANPETTTTVAGDTTELNVVVSNFNNPVYTWTPSTGLSCDSCPVTVANVSETTVFYVRVSEDSANSRCFANDSLVIIINSGLKMPNAFSPNNDGKNDSYGPVNADNAALNITAFRIYNRWGQEVHNAAENWNGKFKGEDQPAGTYIYYISAKTPDETNPGKDKTLNDQGSFTLLR
jgi:gliding motility-associated-like protein